MKIKNRITELFKIEYPVIQAGMVWTSGWRLASAVSECGGLGLIGSGSMKPELFREHIQKCRLATSKAFGVNIPLLRGDAADLVEVAVSEKVGIVFTSAGHPGKHMQKFKDAGMIVVHVVPSAKFGLKAEAAGCDAVVGEGVEAGGHNGADELTTFALIPNLVRSVKIPVIAAGGIVNGAGVLAAMVLGAEGVQIGTRFAVTQESSSHPNYKKRVLESGESDTTLIFRKIGLTRTLKNEFTDKILDAEAKGADIDILKQLLGIKRERIGIFEGDENNGLMEAGQGAALINDIPTVKELFERLKDEYDQALARFI